MFFQILSLIKVLNCSHSYVVIFDIVKNYRQINATDAGTIVL